MKSLFRLMQCVIVILVLATPVVVQGATLTGTAGTVTLTCTDFTQSGFSGNTYLADRNNLGTALPGTERINVTVTDGVGTVLYTVNGDFMVGNSISVANATIPYGTPPAFNPLSYRFTSIAGNGFGEQVLVTASGTCATIGEVMISIDDVTVTEGNSGTVNATFTVSLSTPSAFTVTVTAQTADATTTAGSDYTALPPTLITFNSLETSKSVTVVVNGDTTFEPDETFFVNLSGAVNASIADSQGLGTITNDDAASAAEIPALAPWLLIALGFALLAIGLWQIKG